MPLRRNFQWTLAGNVVNALSQWAMLTVLVKLGSPEMAGQFVFGLAIATPITAFSMLQLRAILVTDARGDYTFSQYLGTRIVMTVLGVAVIIVIAWWSDDHAGTRWVVLLLGLAKCIDCISDIFRGLFQRHERMDLSGLGLMIKGLAGFAALAGLLWATGSLPLACGGMVVAWVLVLVFYDVGQAKRLCRAQIFGAGATSAVTPSFQPDVVFKLVRLALPLGVVLVLASLQTNVPRYVLKLWYDHELLGYFGALAYPMVAGTMVVSALGQAASPRLASYYTQDLRLYRRLLIRLMALGLLLGGLCVAAVALTGRILLTVLYRADYADYQGEFVLLAVAAAITFMVSFCGYGLTAARVFKAQLVARTGSCLIAIAAALWLVPIYGIRGAAWTAVVTALATLVGSLWILGRVLGGMDRSQALPVAAD